MLPQREARRRSTALFRRRRAVQVGVHEAAHLADDVDVALELFCARRKQRCELYVRLLGEVVGLGEIFGSFLCRACAC